RQGLEAGIDSTACFGGDEELDAAGPATDIIRKRPCGNRQARRIDRAAVTGELERVAIQRASSVEGPRPRNRYGRCGLPCDPNRVASREGLSGGGGGDREVCREDSEGSRPTGLRDQEGSATAHHAEVGLIAAGRLYAPQEVTGDELKSLALARSAG